MADSIKKEIFISVIIAITPAIVISGMIVLGSYKADHDQRDECIQNCIEFKDGPRPHEIVNGKCWCLVPSERGFVLQSIEKEDE